MTEKQYLVELMTPVIFRKRGAEVRLFAEALADKLLAAGVIVRNGHWIEEEGTQICSECGEEHEWNDYRASFCENCGAKMELEEGEPNEKQ